MKVFIIGASGLVGSYLYRAFSKKYHTIGTSRTNKHFSLLKIENKTDVFRSIKKIKPDIVVVTAAVTNVDYCETHARESKKINATGIHSVCQAMNVYVPKSLLVFLSTDYIFNGKRGPYKETDIPHPINAYGKQKLRAENYIKNSGLPFLIIRTNWVYGAEKSKKNFVYAIIDAFKNNKPLRVFSDQIANPIYAGDIAKGMLYLVDHKKRGIYHIAGPDLLSRVGLAQKVGKSLKLNTSTLVSLPTGEGNQIAKRPLLSGLITKKFYSQTHMRCVSITQGVKKMLQDEKLL